MCFCSIKAHNEEELQRMTNQLKKCDFSEKSYNEKNMQQKLENAFNVLTEKESEDSVSMELAMLRGAINRALYTKKHSRSYD